MTERADFVRRELRSLTVEVSGDTAATLIRPTKADAEAVEALSAEMDLSPIIGEIAILVAERFSEAVEQRGMRPADYWRMTSVPETLAKRVGKSLSEAPPEFLTAFHATVKGRG